MIFGQKPQIEIPAYNAALGKSLLADLQLPGESLRVLEAIASASPYLARLMKSEHAFLTEALKMSPVDALKAAFQLEGDIHPALRIAKARVALITALADLSGLKDLDWVTSALTEFADFAVEKALKASVASIVDRLPKNVRQESETAGIFALAMGKMGARELNYSSDIDLVFFFDDQIYSGSDIPEIRPILVKAVQRTVKILSERDANGYVFRTDLRLRPNPAVTPVCSSVSSAQDYYIQHGRTWERAAFIKARACAGDVKRGEKFLKGLQGFKWRKNLDFAARSEIRDQLSMTRSHKGLSSKIEPIGHNLKLGRGGIREIEFFVQAQQLIYAGRRDSLRLPRTVEGLKALADAGYLDHDAAFQLESNYVRLRNLEHRIQMLHDAQTHSVPTGDDFERLSTLCNSPDLAQEISDLLLQTEQLTKNIEIGDSDLSVPTKGEIEKLDRLKELRVFQNPRAQENLDRLLPFIWDLIKDDEDPEEVLQYLTTFFGTLSSGVQPLELLIQNPAILQDITKLASLSKPFATRLAQNFDALYGRIDPRNSPPKIDPTDIEEALIGLRHWKNEGQLRIICDQVLGQIDFQQAEAQYTALAETVLKNAVQIALHETNVKHGQIKGSEVAVLAMGKLASAEMTASSDLDMIILFDGPAEAESDGAKPIDLRGYYTYFTRRLITSISVEMAGGRLYEVDMRLRPSGRAGTVATSLSGFKTYQMENAWVWEHLALTRARVVVGSDDFSKRINEVRNAILNAKSGNSKLIPELNEMRDRIHALPVSANDDLPVKKPLGGMLDIELLAQAVALKSLVPAQKPVDQMTEAVKNGYVSEADISVLLNTHRFLGSIEHAKRLIGEQEFKLEMLSNAAKSFILQSTGLDSLANIEKETKSRIAASKDTIDRIINQMDQS